MTICICGGGGLGHTIAGYISAKNKFTVNILTQKPQLWHHRIEITDCYQKNFDGHLATISDRPEDVIPESDIILFSLPGFAIENELERIKPYLNNHQLIGSVVSSTGFFFIAHKILSPTNGLFGFQRVPFISRVDKYGQKASLLGYKKELKLGTEFIHEPDELISALTDMLDTPIVHTPGYLEVSLSNSNPLLHPTRLYNLFKDYQPGIYYPEQFMFYEGWNNASSELLIACDQEFFQILKKLPIKTEEIIPLLDYYESKDSIALTKKIRSITAFKGLKAPMIIISPNKYIPDFSNRYFTEDFPFGICIIKQLATCTNTPTPFIDEIIGWGNQFITASQPKLQFNF